MEKHISTDYTSIVDGLRFAERVRNLDDRTAMKIALALAGSNPSLFLSIADVVRKENIVPPSTLELKPPGTELKVVKG